MIKYVGMKTNKYKMEDVPKRAIQLVSAYIANPKTRHDNYEELVSMWNKISTMVNYPE
jgi:hypothetical protein